MPNRRSKHANHARPSTAPQRRDARRNAAGTGGLYAGGKRGASRGGSVGNVAGFGSSAPTKRRSTHAATARRNAHQSAGRPSLSPTAAGGQGGVQALLTRRGFLIGAAGVGAVAAIGGGVAISQSQNAKKEVTTLEVPTTAVTTSDSLSLVEDASQRMGLIGNFELEYGTMVWCSDETYAACLIPSEGAKPLTQVGLLSLASGNCPIVLEQAVGQSEGFEIYDVRATATGIIWTEADILDGTWRIYTATSTGSAIGTPVLAEEGSAYDWQTPTIAACKKHAFWQVLPQTSGSKSKEASLLKRVRFGSSDPEVAWSSTGRMATAPYALNDGVVITPRAEASSVYYQLTLLDDDSGDIRDTMTLPASMSPLEAGYGKTGFMFSFDAIYSYGDGIANLGTYVPMASATGAGYNNVNWFRFGRTPSAAPAWCGKYLMVKSTMAVVGIDLEDGEYFALEVPDGTADYGEYLASTGTGSSVVTYANIDHHPLDGDAVKCCQVRVWTPVA